MVKAVTNIQGEGQHKHSQTVWQWHIYNNAQQRAAKKLASAVHIRFVNYFAWLPSVETVGSHAKYHTVQVTR